MSKPIYKEIFEFYTLNTVPGIRRNENAKKTIRKTIAKRYREHYQTKDWSELTDVEKADFKIITIKEYLFDKILHPNPNEKKLKPTPEALKIVASLNAKINNELITMHKPLKFMEEHNKSINILYKNFYDESATEEENHNAYLELCNHLDEHFPLITPPSFEEWQKSPQTIHGMREEAISDDLRNHRDNLEDTIQDEPSKVEILEEIIITLLKKLDINMDIEGIKHCLTITRHMNTFNDESIENTPINKDIINSYLRLQDHDFIIKNN